MLIVSIVMVGLTVSLDLFVYQSQLPLARASTAIVGHGRTESHCQYGHRVNARWIGDYFAITFACTESGTADSIEKMKPPTFYVPRSVYDKKGKLGIFMDFLCVHTALSHSACKELIFGVG